MKIETSQGLEQIDEFIPSEFADQWDRLEGEAEMSEEKMHALLQRVMMKTFEIGEEHLLKS